MKGTVSLNPNPALATPLAPPGNPGADSVFDFLTPPVNSRLKQVWAIGGGKGGVGKSLVASNLAISLARSGNKVVAVDLDLGGSNLHTALGIENPRHTLSDFLTFRTPHLQACTVPTGIPQLEMISGAQDSIGVAQLTLNDQKRLLENLWQVQADYLVLDLGAGTNFTIMDFFLFADIGIVVMLPEPTSIENAYRFIKSAYFRRLWQAKSLREIRPLIEMALDPKNSLGMKSPSDLFREVHKRNPDWSLLLKQEIERFRPKLVINQARTQSDIDIGFSVRAVCKKYFGIDMDYVGYFDYDSAVWQAVRRKRPVFMEFPNSRLVVNTDRIVQHMLRRHAMDKSGAR